VSGIHLCFEFYAELNLDYALKSLLELFLMETGFFIGSFYRRFIDWDLRIIIFSKLDDFVKL
jgi:hypothetical protein